MVKDQNGHLNSVVGGSSIDPGSIVGAMFTLDVPWWEIVLRAGIVYVALLIGLRLGGKRELGQMTPFDLVVVLLIANAVQNAMVGSDTSVVGGLIAAAALLVANATLARFRHRIPWLRKVAEGDPVVLMSDGILVDSHLAREGIDAAELEQAAREHGLDGLSEVELAVLEIDGTISIVPQSAETIRTKRRIKTRRQP